MKNERPAFDKTLRDSYHARTACVIKRVVKIQQPLDERR